MTYFETGDNTSHTGLPTPSSSGFGADAVNGLNIIIVGAGLAGLTAAVGLRQQGHHVTILESSALEEQDGACIELFPYANGVLRRFGVLAGNLDKINNIHVTCNGLTEFDQSGALVKCVDNTETSMLWQHPWHRVSRKVLHNALRLAAISAEGPGLPVVLKLHSHVVEVDPVAGSVTLEGGEQIHGDMIIGADGIGSTVRPAIADGNSETPEIGTSTYNFYLTKETLASHGALARYVEKDGQSFSWVGTDRRLDMYPLSEKILVNAAIYPSSRLECETTADQSRHLCVFADMSVVGGPSVDKKATLLEPFKGFHPHVQEIIGLAEESTIRVWSFYGAASSSLRNTGKVILIGDAANVFHSQRLHSAGQALDDAAALAALLPAGTAPEKVCNALEFYQQFRKPRIDKIIQYSQSRRGWTEDEESTFYLFGYDAWDAAKQAGQRYFIRHNRKNWLRQPIQLGLYPSLRQHASGKLRRPQTHVTWTRYGIRFRTSRTVLDGFLPECFSFKSLGSVAEASWISGWTDGMDWLGGAGYHYTSLMLHNVDYTKKDGTKIHGMYQVMMIEDLTDALLGGHDDSGMAKLYAEIDFKRIDDTAVIDFSWRGKTFIEIRLNGLNSPQVAAAVNSVAVPTNKAQPPLPTEAGTLYERYVGAVGQPGVADVQYPVFSSFKGGSGTETKTTKVELASQGSITYYRGDELTLPTWHGYVDRFAEIPFYGFVSGFAIQGTGVDDNRGTVRIE